MPCDIVQKMSAGERQIRKSVHQKLLRRYRNAPDTIVVDELGLHHGSCRADIAVINGRMIGYEIKSDKDDLTRLKRQIKLYDAVFDSIVVVIGPRRVSTISRRVPRHWGIIVALSETGGDITFKTKRRCRCNPRIDPLSVARLLWKSEALRLIERFDATFNASRLPRNDLYEYLVANVRPILLRREVRSCLKRRSNWRDQRRLSPCGGSCQRAAISSGLPEPLYGARTFGCIRPHPKISNQEKPSI